MASRRALVSSVLLRASSSAIRPARPVFALTCRAAVTAQRIQPRASVAPRAARWFSTEDTVPGSKVWGFDEIKKQVEQGKEGKVIIVGAFYFPLN